MSSAAFAGRNVRHIVMLGMALAVALAVALGSIGWQHRPGGPIAREKAAATAQDVFVKPTAPLPEPPPTILADMSMDDARTSNAKVPFFDGKMPVMKPFTFAGASEDRLNAETCLAVAVLYEAGNDTIGEQAVAQVVLNRMRHPAFPNTVCGVVFQGSERKTGCQFSFTCDGSLRRVPQPAAWSGALKVADAALNGFVFKQVGTATHYHTDWVVPYWRDSLQKLTSVHTHIFYRWGNGWGQPAVFTGAYSPPESIDRRIEYLRDPTKLAAAQIAGVLPEETTESGAPIARQTLSIEGVSTAQLRGSVVRLMDADAAQYILQLDPKEFAGSYALVANAICHAKPDCIVLGWTQEDRIPKALPVIPASMRTLAFLYRKSVSLGIEQQLWDCRENPRKDPAQCLGGTRLSAAAPPAVVAVAAGPSPPAR